MALALEPGPVEFLNIEELVGAIPDPDLEAFVLERLADVAGVDAALTGHLLTMGGDLAAPTDLALGADLEAAASAHVTGVGYTGPDFTAEVIAAERGSANLDSLASGFPSPDASVSMPAVNKTQDGFEGVDWDPNPQPRPPNQAPPPSGGNPPAESPDDPFADGVRELYLQYLERPAGPDDIAAHRENPGGLAGVLEAILQSEEYAALLARRG